MKVNDLKNIAIFNKLIDKSKIRKMRKQEVLELLFKSLQKNINRIYEMG